MNPTRHAVRLVAAVASTLVTITIFQSVTMLARPWPSSAAAEVQTTNLGRTTSMVRS
jgi:hypothetical protein